MSEEWARVFNGPDLTMAYITSAHSICQSLDIPNSIEAWKISHICPGGKRNRVLCTHNILCQKHFFQWL